MRQKFEFPLATVEDGEDTLMKGEFMVILELLSELPGAREGKAKVRWLGHLTVMWPWPHDGQVALVEASTLKL